MDHHVDFVSITSWAKGQTPKDYITKFKQQLSIKHPIEYAMYTHGCFGESTPANTVKIDQTLADIKTFYPSVQNDDAKAKQQYQILMLHVIVHIDAFIDGCPRAIRDGLREHPDMITAIRNRDLTAAFKALLTHVTTRETLGENSKAAARLAYLDLKMRQGESAENFETRFRDALDVYEIQHVPVGQEERVQDFLRAARGAFPPDIARIVPGLVDSFSSAVTLVREWEALYKARNPRAFGANPSPNAYGFFSEEHPGHGHLGPQWPPQVNPGPTFQQPTQGQYIPGQAYAYHPQAGSNAYFPGPSPQQGQGQSGRSGGPRGPKARGGRGMPTCAHCREAAKSDTSIKFDHSANTCPRIRQLLNEGNMRARFNALKVATPQPGTGQLAEGGVDYDFTIHGTTLQALLENEDPVLLDTGASHNIYLPRFDVVSDDEPGPPLRVRMLMGATTLTETGTHPVWGPGWICPDAAYSLVSWGFLSKHGWAMKAKGDTIRLSKDQTNEMFYRVDGNLFAWDPTASHRRGTAAYLEDEHEISHHAEESEIESADEYEDIKQLVDAYHVRLGHCGQEALIEFLTSPDFQTPPGQRRPSASELREACKSRPPCPTCLKGNFVFRKALPVRERATLPIGQRLHADLVFLGSHTFLVCKEHATGYLFTVALASKEKEEVTRGLGLCLDRLIAYGHQVRELSTDGEMVFSSLVQDMNARGVDMTQRAPGVHEKDVERSVGTLKKVCRALYTKCIESEIDVPDAAIPYLVLSAARVLNCTPNVHTDGRAPLTLVTGRKLSPADLALQFGDVVVARAPRRSGDNALTTPRGDLCLVLLSSIEGHGKTLVLLLDRPERPTVVMRHLMKRIPITEPVRAKLALWTHNPRPWLDASDEEVELLNPPATTTASDQLPSEEWTLPMTVSQAPVATPTFTTPVQAAPQAPPASLSSPPSPVPPSSPAPSTPPSPPTPSPTPPTATTEVAPSVRVSARNAGRTLDYAALDNLGLKVARTQPSGHDDGVAQVSFKSMEQEDQRAADQALDKEIQQLLRLEAFRPVHPSTLPSDVLSRAILSLLVGAWKQSEDGGARLAKVRLVGRGDLQPKVPFSRTSSPTVALWALYAMLTVAAVSGLRWRSMDVTCAYPNALREGEPIHMWVTRRVSETILRHRPDWAPFVQHDGRMLLFLAKALYGLRDAGLMWHNTVTEALTKGLGMQKISVEPNVFHRGKDFLLAKYVDDLGLLYKDPAKADELLRRLRETWPEGVKCKDGNSVFLGLFVEQPEHDRSIFLVSQPKQYAKLRTDFGNTPKPRWVTPTPARPDLLTAEDSPLVDSGPYLRLLGEIAYLKATRPDIAATLSFLQTFSSRPTTRRMADAHRLMWYLLETEHYGLVIAPQGPLTVDASADASYLIHEDGRSHGGTIVTLASTPIYWSSQKIQMITKSSTTAELFQAERSLARIDEVRDFTAELCQTQLPPSCLLQDNMSAMQLAINGFGKATKSKPWQVRVENLKEHLVDEKIRLQYQPTAHMAADGLTKVLQPADFAIFRARVNVFDLREVRMNGRAALTAHGGVLGIHKAGNTALATRREPGPDIHAGIVNDDDH